MEEEPNDYRDRYAMVQHLQDVPDRLPRDHELKLRDFVVIRTDGRYSVGRVQEIYSDGSAHMAWWNTKGGKCNPAKKWYRAYVDRNSDLGECYDMKGAIPRRDCGI
jgi:hypothetical protein